VYERHRCPHRQAENKEALLKADAQPLALLSGEVIRAQRGESVRTVCNATISPAMTENICG
jgi:hypothetical protein